MADTVRMSKDGVSYDIPKELQAKAFADGLREERSALQQAGDIFDDNNLIKKAYEGFTGTGAQLGDVAKKHGQEILIDDKGQTYVMPADVAKQALQDSLRKDGPNLRLPDLVDERDRVLVAKAEAQIDPSNQGLRGTIKAAGSAAQNQLVKTATFGLVDPEKDALTETDRAAWQQSQDMNKEAAAVGNAAGFVAGVVADPFAIGGTALRAGTAVEKAAVRAMGEGIVAKGVGTLARGATEGAVMAVPEAARAAIEGEPEKAGEALLAAGALGAVFSAAAKPIASLVEKAAAAPTKMAEEKAFRSLNYSRNLKAAQAAEELPEGARGVGRTLLDNDLVRKVGEPWEKYAERVSNARRDAGAAIGTLYGRLDEAAASGGRGNGLASAAELADRVDDEVIAPLRKELGTQGIVRKLEAFKQDFVEKAGAEPLTFQRLHEYRQQLDNMIWREGQIGITDPAKRELANARRILTGELEAKGSELTAGAFKQELGDANLLYRRLKVAEDATEKSAATVLSNRTLSPSDHGIGIGAALMGAVTGHPWAAVHGLAAAAGNKLLRENGNAVAARVLNEFKSEALLAAMERGGEVGKVASLNAMARLAGLDETTPKHEQFEAVRDRLTQLQTDPDKRSAVLAHVGGEQMGEHLGLKTNAALDYLYAQLPKEPPRANLFRKREPWRPSDGQVAAFERKVQVVTDPTSILEELRRGTLTKDHVDALQAVYPAIAFQLRDELLRKGADPKAPVLTKAQRTKLQLLLGEPLDDSSSVAATKMYQDLYVDPGDAQRQAERSARPVKVDKLPSSMTEGQRLAAGVRKAG